jgi:hypothetical protein
MCLTRERTPLSFIGVRKKLVAVLMLCCHVPGGYGGSFNATTCVGATIDLNDAKGGGLMVVWLAGVVVWLAGSVGGLAGWNTGGMDQPLQAFRLLSCVEVVGNDIG